MAFDEVSERVGGLEREGDLGTQKRALNGVPVNVVFRFLSRGLAQIRIRGVRNYKKTREALSNERKLVAWVEERAGPCTGATPREFLWELPTASIRTYCDLSLHARFEIPKR